MSRREETFALPSLASLTMGPATDGPGAKRTVDGKRKRKIPVQDRTRALVHEYRYAPLPSLQEAQRGVIALALHFGALGMDELAEWHDDEKGWLDYYEKKYGPLREWDVSDLTDLSGLFTGVDFSDVIEASDLAHWDTSSAQRMLATFNRFKFAPASGAALDLENWDVSSVVDMNHTFSNATMSVRVSSWDTSSVQNMAGAFLGFSCRDRFLPSREWPEGAVSPDLSKWNVESVITTSDMFSSFWFFDMDLSGWNLESVQNMSGMFDTAYVAASTNTRSTFNDKNILAWRGMGRCHAIDSIFYDATFATFDHNRGVSESVFRSVAHWNVASVENASYAFADSNFAGDLSRWDTRSLENASSMFQRAKEFQSDLSQWDVSKLRRAKVLFEDARSFKSDLSRWDMQRQAALNLWLGGASSFGPPLVRSGAGEEGAVWTEESMRAHLDFVRNDETLQTYKSVRVRRRWRRLLWLFKEKKRFWTKREQREIEEYEGGTGRLKRYLRLLHRGGLGP